MVEPIVHSHWHMHFEDLQLSSQELYAEIETVLAEKLFPDVQSFRRSKLQSSFFSSKREYLCVERFDLQFYICAAPFGRNFFVSYFLGENSSFFAKLLLLIPFVGRRLYNRFLKKTFYELDSELIFLESIGKIVRHTLEQVLSRQGIRLEVVFQPIQLKWAD